MTELAAALVQKLLRPEAFDHPVAGLRVVETHISWVILTGPYAYKIKKPVELGFVDFGTLERRKFFCEEELRLNRRLAPELYVEVVAIRGDPARPRMGGGGEAIEYAVKMRQFPESAELERALERGEPSERHFETLARELHAFHRSLPAAPPDSPWGGPESVHRSTLDNFREIRGRLAEAEDARALDAVAAWSEAEHLRLAGAIESRRRRGWVRECHGDLHLGNLVLLDDRIVPFDGIEFSEALRWNDVVSEAAFLVMDLEFHGRADLANGFLNAYLEEGGDYDGLRVLPYYLVYRALVRAKVAAIRMAQASADAAERRRLLDRFRRLLALAEGYTRPPCPSVAITHGLSGSGKTTLSRRVAAQSGAIRINSDVERKRLFGLRPLDRSSSGISAGIYTPEATARTYNRLLELASRVVELGYPVVVDAAFLKHDQRRPFARLAETLRVPLWIYELKTPVETLRRRIEERRARGGDASEADLAVLERQMAGIEPLGEDELAHLQRPGSNEPLDAAPAGRVSG
jgi:hypothetical protein